MRVKYFSDTDTALLEFTDNPVAETREISENIYADLDQQGNLATIHGHPGDDRPKGTLASIKRQADLARGKRS